MIQNSLKQNYKCVYSKLGGKLCFQALRRWSAHKTSATLEELNVWMLMDRAATSMAEGRQ
jgi:hypothetical protein